MTTLESCRAFRTGVAFCDRLHDCGRQVVEMDILADPDRLSRLDLSAIEPEPLAVVTFLPVVPSSSEGGHS
jgi:hypothetical protein